MSTGETRALALPQIESISAVILAAHDMARAVRFYSALGFPIRYGGVGCVHQVPRRHGSSQPHRRAQGLALLEVEPFDLLRLGRERQARHVATHE
jgi:hypothetical protein